MKKYIAIILAVIMLLSVFGGCTSKKKITNDIPNEAPNGSKDKNTSDEYTTAILDYSDAVVLSGLSVEYEIHGYEEFKDKKGPSNVTYKTPEGEEKKVDLSGITGTFVPNKYYPIYKYGKNMYFNPNGKLEKYTCYDVNRPSEVTCSKEEAISVAKEMVSDIINVSEYTVSVSKVEDIWNYYSINFYKYVGNIKTTECARVYVTFDGKIFSYWAGMLDQFTDVTENPFDMDKVKETVHARLDELTKDIKDDYDEIEYENEEYRLTRLKDGSLAILYTGDIGCINYWLETHNGETIEIREHGGERIEMLIMQ